MKKKTKKKKSFPKTGMQRGWSQDSHLNIASWCFMSLPSFSQVIVLTGFPSYLHVKTAGLPKSTVCVAGSTVAFSGAVTVSTVSTDSPEREYLELA